MAECFDLPICPHFLMEIHVSLVCAVQNGRYVEYIPQLDEITGTQLQITNGMARAPETSGIGIDWDWDALCARAIPEFNFDLRKGV
jgi:L-alanine-DL-glutamate epimerase-like enolase superfamily enzyme